MAHKFMSIDAAIIEAWLAVEVVGDTFNCVIDVMHEYTDTATMMVLADGTVHISLIKADQSIATCSFETLEAFESFIHEKSFRDRSDSLCAELLVHDGIGANVYRKV